METSEPLELFKSRDFGDQLGLTFTFIRENFRLLGKCVLFIAGPLLLVSSFLFGSAINAGPYRSYGATGGAIGSVFLAMLILVLAFSVMTTVINEFVALYAEKGPDGFTLEEVWGETRRDVLKVSFTYFCGAIVIGLASMLFLIPGIYCFGIYTVVVTVQVYERCSISESVSRSIKLVRGHWWLAFGIFVVPFIIAMVMRYFFEIPALLAVFAEGYFTGHGDRLGVLSMVGTVIATFGGALCSALPTVATALNYFNLREKHDGVGLMRRIQTIGGNDADSADDTDSSEKPGSADATGW
ncbi:MAG: hypothetical protein JWQ98_709 [Chlorobi bacterium]|nr:hypothetical protein [Chlorobiota bacterium]